ncbi:MAG: IclR family transcriptional regulator [Symbiobacterium sp.]|uniref:IclR family transcriptional regulator n=1 Tax=Symbiobacterium sp. TaxID=1971213 RepID=UPI0034640DBA
MGKENGSGLTKSVARALSILSCFSDRQPELRVSDFARMLGLTVSNVSRLLATMETLGYVERDENTGLFRPGMELLTLAGIALNLNDVRRASVDELQRLERALGLGTNLAVLRDDSIFYLAHFDGPQAPRGYTLLGRRNPLHATAIGKVLLAHLPEDQLNDVLARIPLTQFTTSTITDPNRLREELAQIRQQGFATEVNELALGRGCVAAPVRNRVGQVVAGISISGPLSAMDFEHRKDKLARIIIEAADNISLKLGYITVYQ